MSSHSGKLLDSRLYTLDTLTHADSPGIYWQQWEVEAICAIGPRSSLLVLLPGSFPVPLVK